jgi:hypothetical protein
VPTSRSHRSDIKLIVSATLAVLFAGFLIAGGLWVGSRSDTAAVCAPLDVGHVSDVRQNLTTQGPNFLTAGGACGFWIALDNGNIVAYKVRQPGCTLVLKREGWVCGGKVVPASSLAQFPVSIQPVGGVDAVLVQFNPPTTTT